MNTVRPPRPSWDQYFMDIAHVAATRSNCSRRQVAAVLVRDCRIISTGYNGTAAAPGATPTPPPGPICTSAYAAMRKRTRSCRPPITGSR